MSDLVVEICEIKKIKKHPNADRLEVCIVKGWECITPKGHYKKGDKVLYIPPDAVLSEELSDKLGITKYLSKQRVRVVRLRGEMSYGIIADAEDYPEGEDLKDLLGITKWEPPVRTAVDRSRKSSWWGKFMHYFNILYHEKLGLGRGRQPLEDGPLFHRYTDIQNVRNYPDVLEEGEPVVFTEKIHGTNSRVGYIKEGRKYKFAVGSHKKRRYVDKYDTYSIPLTVGMKEMLKAIAKQENANSVIVFSEIYGDGVQDLKYGLQGKKDFRVFDISVDFKYLPYEDMLFYCNLFSIKCVPILLESEYNTELVRAYTKGPTTVDGDHVREGIVIKPMKERRHYKLGRVILKSINEDYLLRKDGTEYH